MVAPATVAGPGSQATVPCMLPGCCCTVVPSMPPSLANVGLALRSASQHGLPTRRAHQQPMSGRQIDSAGSSVRTFHRGASHSTAQVSQRKQENYPRFWLYRPLFCVPEDTVPEAFGAALRADEAPPCVHKRRDVVHERDLVIRDVTAREELPAQHGKGPDVALFAVPGKGGVSQAVKRKQGVGSFLDFVRRSGTARTTHPRGAYVRTCGELNDIDLPAIRPLLNAPITYLPPRDVHNS